MTSNNLRCEMDFHAEANSIQNKKFNLHSANKVSVWHAYNIGALSESLPRASKF